MRPLVLLCGALATVAALSLRWTTEAPRRDGLTVIFGSEPATLDPAMATTILEARVLRAFLEGLVVADGATLEPRPGVAEAWDVSEDGLTYTFRLREARWSDGAALTAEDFRWSWERAVTLPESKNWEMLACIRGARALREKKTSAMGVEARDARTLVVTLERPVPYFLNLLTTPAYLPVPRAAVEAGGRRWTRRFPANGPFVPAEWRPNDRIVGERNPRYREPSALASVTFLSVPPGPAQFNLYAGGTVDWIADPHADLVADLAGRPDLHVSPLLAVSLVRFACNREPFSNARVRQAFSVSIDRERLTSARRAGEVPWGRLVPPRLGHEPPAKPPLSDSPRSLLGPGAFPRARLLFQANKGEKIKAQVLQAVWKERLGIEVVLEGVDRQEWLRRMRAVDYELCLGSWVGDYPDPNTFLEIWKSDSPNNRTGWASADYDRLIERAARETGAARLGTLAEAEALLMEMSPAAGLYVPVTVELWRGNLKGVSENLAGVHPLGGVRRE